MTLFLFSSPFTHTKFSVFSCLGGVGTCAASSSTVMSKCIFWRVFVAAKAVSLFCFFRAETVPSENIYSLRNGLKVVRVYADFITAKMVQDFTRGHLSMVKFVTESMCFYSPVSRGHVEGSITFTVGASKPIPASTEVRDEKRKRPFLINFRPKSFLGGNCGFRHDSLIPLTRYGGQA